MLLSLISKVVTILMLYATDSSTWVVTHNSFFKSNCLGSGSYNFINTVGLFLLEVSNKTLFAIIVLLPPKFK